MSSRRGKRGPEDSSTGPQRLASSRHAIASVDDGTLTGPPAIASNSWVSSAATSRKSSPAGTSCQIAFLSSPRGNDRIGAGSAIAGDWRAAAISHMGRIADGMAPGLAVRPPDRRGQQSRSHDCMPIRSVNAGTTPFLPRKSTLTSDSLIVTRRCLGVLYVESSIGWPSTKAC